MQILQNAQFNFCLVCFSSRNVNVSSSTILLQYNKNSYIFLTFIILSITFYLKINQIYEL